jgi:hypothetical protein
MSAHANREVKVGMGSPPDGGSGMGRVVLRTGATMNEGMPR